MTISDGRSCNIGTGHNITPYDELYLGDGIMCDVAGNRTVADGTNTDTMLRAVVCACA